jgi:predicted AAA+ superfamily ATPase
MSDPKVPYRRELTETIKSRMVEPRRFIQVVTGPRQTGKSTALLQALSSQPLLHRMASVDTIFEASGNWLESEWDAARRLVSKEQQAAVLVIDEIQNIPQWSSYVKKLWDEDARSGIDLRVVLSGSSSLLLQEGLTESLMGRFETLYSTHWGFSEMREAFGYTLEDFLVLGGYPGAAQFKGDFLRWNRYMRDSVVEATISKDALQMQSIRKPAVLRRLFLLGSSYSAQEISYRKMLGQLDDKGNTDTIAEYLELLSKAGLLTGLQKYDASKLITLRRSSPRLMVHDTSLMTASLANSQEDIEALLSTPDLRGHVVESAVGAYLLAVARKTGFEVLWWRDGDYEVDFVLRYGRKVVAIEVKSGRNKRADGLYEFARRYPGARTLLVGDSNCPLETFLIGSFDLF